MKADLLQELCWHLDETLPHHYSQLQLPCASNNLEFWPRMAHLDIVFTSKRMGLIVFPVSWVLHVPSYM
jgi:hypothetical protein